jgi:7-cyano-7-deazaguanine synthase
MRESSEVMVLLSGGIDSMACVHFFKEMGRMPCGLFIDYGQPPADRESKCAKMIAEHFGIILYSSQWKSIQQKKSGYIPARNAFLLITALMEKPTEVNTIVLGIHSGTSYPDCQTKFMDKMQQIFDLYSSDKTRISCPFIDFQKVELYSYCKEQHLPIELTYSCESSSLEPCGKCLSCIDREMLNVGT